MNIRKRGILGVADEVARLYDIDLDEVVKAMGAALEHAAVSYYGDGYNIKAQIEASTGELLLSRELAVVDVVEDHKTQIALDDAMEIDLNVKVGESIHETLPIDRFNRAVLKGAQKQVMQSLNAIKQSLAYERYKDRVGDLVRGRVEYTDFGNAVLNIESATALLPSSEMIPKEVNKVGDMLLACILEVKQKEFGHQIILSRTSNEFLLKLLHKEVPEIAEGSVIVKSIAREPGSKAKVAVFAREFGLDAVGCCVGVKGTRVRAISEELMYEKIEILLWSDSIATFIANALSSVEITKIVVDEEQQRAEIVIPDSDLSIAIGRKGQNVRLACMLTGWKLKIVSEEEADEIRNQRFNRFMPVLIEALDIEEIVAKFLILDGFETVESIVSADVSDLLSIDVFDNELAAELHQRACDYMHLKTQKVVKDLKEHGMSDDLIEFPFVGLDHKLILVANNIKNIDALSDLSSDEFMDIITEISKKEADEIIIEARKVVSERNI